MNHVKKIIVTTTTIISLIASNSFIYANDNAPHEITIPNHTHDAAFTVNTNHAESQKANLAVIIQNGSGKKRNMAMSRVLWSGIKCVIGWELLVPGTLVAIVSPLGILTGVATVNGPLIAGSSVAFMCSVPAAYLGYKLIQSSHETYRDELIESAGLK